MSLEGIFNIISKLPGFERLKNILLQTGYQQYSRVMSSPLWKGVFVIGGGTALAQGIGIISTPIITRLYDPSDFGLLAIYSSVLTILLVIASLRYEYAIPVPKDSSRAANLLILCLMIITGVTGILCISFLLIGDRIAEMLDLQDLLPYLWLVLVGFLGAGIYQALNYWAIRQRDYPRITRTKINQSLGGSLSKILFGFLALGPLGLILGHIISNVAGIYTFTKAIIRKDRSTFRDISVTGIKSVAREYRSFPMYSAPATLLFAVSLQIPVFMLTVMYGLDVVGWYTLAHQMLALPVALISGSMAQAFYGEAAKSARERPETLRRLYLDTTKKLALIGIPLLGVIAIVAPWIFPIVFGGAWEEAGLFCLPLALVAVSQFIVTPTSKLAVYGFNHWDLYFNCARMVMIFGGFYFANMFGFEPLITLTVYGTIMVIMYLVLCLLNLRAIDRLNLAGGSSFQ
jgi:O-antigen/teichoic acid export membrane protein